jgi:hypothetical protein
MTDRSVLAYVDSQGDLRCVSGAGLMAISDEGFKALTELQGHLELAIACRETLGGIPISVRQACSRDAGAMRDALAAAHLLHDMALTLAGERKAN